MTDFPDDPNDPRRCIHCGKSIGERYYTATTCFRASCMRQVAKQHTYTKKRVEHYLTEEEFLELSRIEANRQIILGLETCRRRNDVMRLLDDVRLHEKLTLMKEANEAKNPPRKNIFEDVPNA